MFFHPNDGTVPYPPSNDCDYTVLWERIGDLEDQNMRQSTRIDDLHNQLERYQGRVLSGTGQICRREITVPTNLIENRHFIAAEINNFALDVGRQLVTNETVEQEIYNDYQGNSILRLTFRNT
jgi:hypothetical protein